jgi:hypothetical protein
MIRPPSSPTPGPPRPTPRRRSLRCVVLAVIAGGCTGQVLGDAPAQTGKPKPPGSSGSAGNSGNSGNQGTPVVAGAPATGQRLTDRQYLNVITDLFGVDASAEALTMPLDPKLEGFRNAASSLLPSDIRIEGYASLARTITGKIDWAQLLARESLCAEATDKCRRDFVATLGRRLFRRPLTDAQITRFGAVFEAVAKEGDAFPVAAALVVAGMLQSPEFLYRLERPGARVDDFELATRLSFLLWNSAPDGPLLEAATQAKLSGASLHAQVTRMMADPRARRALRDYVDDWLDADKLLRTSRDPAVFPQFSGTLAADMREEIHRLFERVVWQDDADLVEVLRAEHTMLTPALARLYGLPAGAGTAFAEQDLRQVPTRAGLLTQAGILTLTSVGGPGSSIVDRGAFVLRNFTCRHVPEPPNNVPELPAAESGKSERERLAQHRADPACASCHDHLDPLGLAFEAYDAIGALQTKDQAGNALTGAGSLMVGTEEVPYTNVREFVAALTRSADIGACMARKVVQYAFARPLFQGDEPLVTELSGRFTRDGNRYQAFLGALAESSWIQTGVSP